MIVYKQTPKQYLAQDDSSEIKKNVYEFSENFLGCSPFNHMHRRIGKKTVQIVRKRDKIGLNLTHLLLLV